MSIFPPDLRNSGGRSAIVRLMTNHFACLKDIKPVINASSIPRSPKPKSNERSTMDFTEVKEAVKRTNRVFKQGNLRAGVNTSKPMTFDMSAQLSSNRARRQKRLMNEHYTNIRHMARRIQDIGRVSLS